MASCKTVGLSFDLSLGSARIICVFVSPEDNDPSRANKGDLSWVFAISFISNSTSERNSSVAARTTTFLPGDKESEAIKAAWATAKEIPFRSEEIMSQFIPAIIIGSATSSMTPGETLQNHFLSISGIENHTLSDTFVANN